MRPVFSGVGGFFCLCGSLWLVVLLVSPWGVCQAGAPVPGDESHVEAAFLFHFAQLVDWPAGAESSADNSLFVCTIDDDPFQGALEETMAGKPVGNRIVRIRHLDAAEDMQSCQVVFIGKADSKRVPTLVAALHNAPVLTVGDGANFLDAGGMIRFVVDDNKVRFDVNLNAAQSARLKIGSRVLVLAEHVVGEAHDK
jgi:hypothetical protein